MAALKEKKIIIGSGEDKFKKEQEATLLFNGDACQKPRTTFGSVTPARFGGFWGNSTPFDVGRGELAGWSDYWTTWGSDDC